MRPLRGNSRTQGRDTLRDRILNIQAKAFADQGVGHSTMEDVAEAAGLSKGRLFLYFGTTAELFFGVSAVGFCILGDLFVEGLEQGGAGLNGAHRMGEVGLGLV
jgi:AcrR family transcriptional regulator